MARQIDVGEVVAGFRVKSLIGQGAMGAVYLAEDTAGGALVAVKVLAPELAQDERFRQRFLRESQIATRLDTPHAVRTIASGEENGVLYLAMEYVGGSDLRRLLQDESRLEPARAIALVGQVAEALDAAHRAGLVHRDVKPGNILIEQQADGEQAVICDFGLARHVSSVSSLTGDRGFVGTVDYVPPEQIEGKALDGRADVYSLGCVLFECLSGRRPFARESELSVVFAHLHDPPASITALCPGLPAAFDDVFAKALAKSPGERFATCAGLAEAATAALQGRGLPQPRRRPRRALLSAVVMLAATGAGLGAFLSSEDLSAAARPKVTQASIDGAGLGHRQAWYQKTFGGGGLFVNQPHDGQEGGGTGYPTLQFSSQKVYVFFPHGINGKAAIITTWNKDFRTDRGIGPCSTVRQMLKAYGPRARPDSFGTIGSNVFQYDVGRNLIFAAPGPAGHPSKFITAVGLFNGSAKGADKPFGALPYAGFVTGNETQKCVP